MFGQFQQQFRADLVDRGLVLELTAERTARRQQLGDVLQWPREIHVLPERLRGAPIEEHLARELSFARDALLKTC